MSKPTQAQIDAAAWDDENDAVAAALTAALAGFTTQPTQTEAVAWERGFKAAIGPTIERCAQVAETDNNHCGKRIAAAIRALADKPQPDPNIIHPGTDMTNVFPEEEP